MAIRWGLLFSWLFILVAFTGCTVSDEETEKEERKNKAKETLRESTVPIFTYYEHEEELFKMHGFEPDFIGERVLFKGEHIKNGESNSSTYITMKNQYGWSVKDLLHDEIGDTICQKDKAISPNGDFIVLQCDDQESSIYVYNLLDRELVYKEQLNSKKAKMNSSVVAITNSGDLILQNRTDKKIDVENIYSKKRQTFELPTLLNEEDFLLHKIKVTGDGSQIMINTKKQIYLLDTKTREIRLLQDHKDIDMAGEVEFSNIHISNNGRYLYFESDNSQQRSSERMVTFIDMESETVRSYEGFGPYLLRNITNDGRVLVVDLMSEKARVFIFDFPEQILQQVEIDQKYLSESSQTFELSPSGDFLLYNGKVSIENEHKHHLLQMRLYEEFLDEEEIFDYELLEEHQSI